MFIENIQLLKLEANTRVRMIAKVKEVLIKKSNIKKKRDIQKASSSVGRIFEKYKIEKFFKWKVGKRGNLSWDLKQDIIEKEKILDGCYVIKTNASNTSIDKNETVNCYRDLQKVEQAFKNMKTILLELRPVYHKTDDRIKAHIFIVMLAYYLQWHAMQRLKPLFDADGVGKYKRWSFENVISRLKSIQKIESLINGNVVKINISKPTKEQSQILNLLGVDLM